jgi:hypothetical protein
MKRASVLRQEAGPHNCQRRVKPHLAIDEARPGVASVLARWDDG